MYAKKMLSVILIAAEFTDFSDKIGELIKMLYPPLIAIAVAISVLWGAYIGFKFWSAGGDEQKKKQAKSALISYVIGIVVMFVIAAGTPLVVAAFQTWVLS